MERLLIVDGLNQFIRNWTIVPSLNSNGESIGGVVGFIRSLKFVMKDVKPTRVVVAWDGEGGSLKRRAMYSEYKQGRRPRVNRPYDLETSEESAANLKRQYIKLRHLLEMLGVIQVEIDSVEADDVIGFISRHLCYDDQKVIMTSDRDMWQLIDRKTIVYSTAKKKYYTVSDFKEEVKILPENYILMKALMGDGSDNVKGIKGIGDKTVVKLFPFLAERGCTMKDVFEHCEANKEESPKYRSILDNRELLIGNVDLMQLTSPIISAHAARVIRENVKNTEPKFILSEFKLSLIRDGIQLTDGDLFQVFQEYQKRAQKEEKTDV